MSPRSPSHRAELPSASTSPSQDDLARAMAGLYRRDLIDAIEGLLALLTLMEQNDTIAARAPVPWHVGEAWRTMPTRRSAFLATSFSCRRCSRRRKPSSSPCGSCRPTDGDRAAT